MPEQEQARVTHAPRARQDRDPAGIRRDKFLAAQLEGATVGQACALAGISRATGTRWRQDPKFQEQLAATRQDLLRAAVDTLRARVGGVIDTLTTIAADVKAPANGRVYAAREVLSAMFKGVETVDFERRLVALEAVAGEEK